MVKKSFKIRIFHFLFHFLKTIHRVVKFHHQKKTLGLIEFVWKSSKFKYNLNNFTKIFSEFLFLKMLNHSLKTSFESQLFHNQIYYFFKKCSEGVSILYEIQGLHKSFDTWLYIYIYTRKLLIILIIVTAIMKAFNYENLTKLTRLLEYYLNIFNT
jgi:hypothetical protein